MKVSFCEHNVASGKVKDMLQKNYPQIETTVNMCIGTCNKCGAKYIARVDGKLLEGETSEELYDEIIKAYV